MLHSLNTQVLRTGPIDASTFVRISLQTSACLLAGSHCRHFARTPGTRAGPIDTSTFIRISLHTSCTFSAGSRCQLFAGTHQVLGRVLIDVSTFVRISLQTSARYSAGSRCRLFARTHQVLGVRSMPAPPGGSPCRRAHVFRREAPAGSSAGHTRYPDGSDRCQHVHPDIPLQTSCTSFGGSRCRHFARDTRYPGRVRSMQDTFIRIFPCRRTARPLAGHTRCSSVANRCQHVCPDLPADELLVFDGKPLPILRQAHQVLWRVRSMPARSSRFPCRRAHVFRRDTPGARAWPIDASMFVRISLQTSARYLAGSHCRLFVGDTPGARTGPIDASTFIRIFPCRRAARLLAGSRCRLFVGDTPGARRVRSMPARSSGYSPADELHVFRRDTPSARAWPIDASMFVRISLQLCCTSFGGKLLPALRRDTPAARRVRSMHARSSGSPCRRAARHRIEESLLPFGQNAGNLSPNRCDHIHRDLL